MIQNIKFSQRHDSEYRFSPSKYSKQWNTIEKFEIDMIRYGTVSVLYDDKSIQLQAEWVVKNKLNF